MVIDASIIIKWIKQANEYGSDEAFVIYEKFDRGEISLSVPDLVFYELSNYASRQNNEIFLACQDLISNLFSSRIEVVTPDRILVENATNLAKQLGISGYDAFYLTVAEKLRTKLLTADNKLLTIAPELTTPLQTTLSASP